MANKFYDAGPRRSAKVNDLFATVASRYDLINDFQSFGLHRYWKRKLIKLANVRVGDRALDLCCGTGDVSLALARCGAKAVGLDFSGPMLAVARERNALPRSLLHPRSPIQFLHGDALRIPFADAQFDVVTISYGLRNLADLETGLREMSRVLKPGGRLLVLDFGKPEHPIWRGCYFVYLKWFVPLFGRLFCGDADTYAYILESLQHYPAQRGVAEKMRQIGCISVRIINLLGGIMSINYGERAR